MSKWTPVSSEEEKAIRGALETGKSQYQVAKDFSRGSSTISRIATKYGLGHSDPKTKPAYEARARYASDERILLLVDCFEKGRELLAKCETPRGYKDIMVGLGIALDKRHLEEGGAGSQLGELKLLFSKMEGRP